MTLIPAENVARRDDDPLCLEVDIVADHPELPISLVALSTKMTEEESAQAVDDLRRQIDAVGTLVGQAPPEMVAMLESLESGEEEQRAFFSAPFPICWN